MKEAVKQVSPLVERFQRNIDAYHSPAYNETQLRIEFIDPFFEALGWDVANKEGHAEQYKDVIHEDAIKVAGATKAPDYCFRIGGARKFFLETKKPSIDIKDQVSPAYQLRRYAWSAKLPLSILTNFEEMAVYDCRLRPKPNDKPSVGRIRFFTYAQYLDSFEEINNIFSKESVLKGSFDRFAESEKLKRGTAEVDAEFLREIESWREVLAKDIAMKNQKLSIRELNYAVQLTIDRIIFLRMCEDRGIEKYGQIQNLLNGTNTYRRLREIFYHADDKYNSGLFDFKTDLLTPELKVDDKPLKDIFKNLYYPESPYEFSVLGADILGHVYEQFLGKVIRLTEGHRAKVEEKPEVRKAGGVYYTPTYIVDYIVKNTVGKLCEGKSPRQISSFRILDPACGSGSFLLGAYQYLLDYHRDWYQKDGSQKHTKEIYQGRGGQWFLTIQEKKRILLNNIYGVDIDPQAVEVTKLSLLLRVLEGESQDTLERQMKLFREALPDLGNNIKCGNSLIGPDFYAGGASPFLPGLSVGAGHVPPGLNQEEMYRINPFDWHKEFPEIMKQGGFDAVVGNPPYGMVSSEILKDYFEKQFATAEGRFDTYELFIERGTKLCGKRGLLGFIVPSTLLTNLYTRKLRTYLLEQCTIKEITNFGMEVFEDPTIHTCIVVISQGHTTKHKVKIRKQVLTVNELYDKFDYDISQSLLGKSQNATFDIFVDPAAHQIVTKLQTLTRPLGEICFIRQCIKTGNDQAYVQLSNRHPGDPWKPTLRGKSISRYAMHETNLYVKYGQWLARNWKNTTFYETPKIAIRETGSQIIATLDLENRYFLSSLYAIYSKSKGERVSLKYLLGLLNSSLATYYVKIIALDITKGAFTKFRTNQLARLPIRIIDFSDPKDKGCHDKMVVLVEQLLTLHKQSAATKTPDDKTRLQRQIDATDQQIDLLVYDLYGLTEKEIQIVEQQIR
jgi:type I restriction-modification system DNA methylase subunit